HPVAADIDPLALGLPPDLLDAIDAVVVLLVYPGDVALEHLIVARTGRGRARRGGVVGGGGDLEDLTDRLHPPSTPTGLIVPVGVDEGDYLMRGRASSAPKKNAA